MKSLKFILTLTLITLAGCQPMETAITPTRPSSPSPSPPTAEASATAPATSIPEPASLSFEATSYQDPSAGFEIQYPRTWMADTISFGSGMRDSLQLTSWTHDPGMFMVAEPGGTFMNVDLWLREPTGDLSTFIEYRRSLWEMAGTVVESTQELTLASGLSAREFVVSTVDGSHSFMMFSALGEYYLMVSGSGDLNIVREIANTLQPLEK